MRHGWSIERRDWHDLAALVADRAWHRVPFGEVSRELVPNGPGVYAICTHGRRLKGGLFAHLYNVVYVGKAKDLHVRFLQHCLRPEREIRSLTECFPDLEYWFVSMYESELDLVETTLIDCLGPAANRQRGIAARIGPPVSLTKSDPFMTKERDESISRDARPHG